MKDLTKKENWNEELVYVHRSRLVLGFCLGILACLCMVMVVGCRNQKQVDKFRDLEMKIALQDAAIKVQNKALNDLTKLIKKIEADLETIPRWSRLPPRIK